MNVTLSEYKKMVKKNKYHNVKVEYAGHKFDSKKECARFKELAILEAVGEICNIELQKRFPLITDQKNGKIEASYVADFFYMTKDGKKVIEDVKSKGTKTALYKLKKKIMLSKGFKIIEIE